MASITGYRHVVLGDLVGNLRHHKNFLSDGKTQGYIRQLRDKLLSDGLERYLVSEYPITKPPEKLIIINDINGALYVPNGNTHLVSMVLANERLTIGDILDTRPQALRYWEAGYEADAPPDKRQYMPYPIYVSRDLNAPWIPNAKYGYDYFRDPPIPILEIPANIPFDSDRWPEEDRGRKLFETASALRKLL